MNKYFKIIVSFFIAIASIQNVSFATNDNAFIDSQVSVLFQINNEIPEDTIAVNHMLTFRGSPRFEWPEYHLAIRDSASLITQWFAEGAENYYIGLKFGPSIELDLNNGRNILYFLPGGGFGLTDSVGNGKGMGQDLTLNYMFEAGMRYLPNSYLKMFTGIQFQHLSNLGMKDPNLGLNALGPTIGLSFRW